MPRRGENIYKRSDGRWEGRYISGRRPDGRACYRSVYAASYQEVRARLAAEKSAHTAQKSKRCRLTVNALCLQWLETVRGTVKASSYARYAHLVQRHLLPAMGALRPEALTANLLSGFVSDLLRGGRIDGRGGLSPKTAQDIVIVLKAVLKTAGLEYDIPDCAAGLKLPKAAPPEARVLSDTDIPVLEKGLRRSGNSHDLGMLLCLYTGLRLGEVCALRWSDFDWRENVLRVRGTVARLPDEGERKTRLTVTCPKTARAERVIPLPDTVSEALRKIAVGSEKDAYILTGSARPMDPRTYQYRFQRTLTRLHIPPVNFHALRHTFATQCVRRGMDVKTLSELLGHATVRMTLDRYVHSSLEAKRRQMAHLRFT